MVETEASGFVCNSGSPIAKHDCNLQCENALDILSIYHRIHNVQYHIFSFYIVDYCLSYMSPDKNQLPIEKLARQQRRRQHQHQQQHPSPSNVTALLCRQLHSGQFCKFGWLASPFGFGLLEFHSFSSKKNQIYFSRSKGKTKITNFVMEMR